MVFGVIVLVMSRPSSYFMKEFFCSVMKDMVLICC